MRWTEAQAKSDVDPLIRYRMRHIQAAMVTSALLLVFALLYLVLPGRPRTDEFPLAILLAIGIATATAALLSPWKRILTRAKVPVQMGALYAWALSALALVSIAVAITGGADSALFVVYFTMLLFLGGSAYPTAGRRILAVLTVLSYVAVLAATGWPPRETAGTVFRIGMLASTAFAATFLADRIVSELRFHAHALDDFLTRAKLWSVIARHRTRLESASYGELPSSLLESLEIIGFEVAVVADARTSVWHLFTRRELPAPSRRLAGLVEALFDEPESRRHALVIQNGSIDAVQPPNQLASTGMVAYDSTRAAAVHEYGAHNNGRHARNSREHPTTYLAPPFNASLTDSPAGRRLLAGFDWTSAAIVPVLADGSIVMVLLGGSRTEKVPSSEQIAALELIASSASRNIERVIRDARDTELAFNASHDALTGLVNRARLISELDSHLAPPSSADPTSPNGDDSLADGPDQPVAVCFMDLDSFKNFNDSTDRTTADELLRAVSLRLLSAVREGDLVARVGGDEFAIMLKDFPSKEASESYASRLARGFDSPFHLESQDAFIGVTIGIASSVPGDTGDQLLSKAEAALHNARQQGTRIGIFDDEFVARVSERIKLETDLHNAIDSDELFLVYQPIVSLDGARAVGMEALLRWRHPERGIIPPLSFIPLAEETGIITEIGRWVLETAATQLAAWERSMTDASGLYVSANASSRQLQSDDIVAHVAAALEVSGLPPEHLVVEITESSLIRDLDAVTRRLEQIRSLGVRVSLDDFGTGYSSLSWLSRLPIDIVKIDKSFVDRLGSANDAIIAAIVSVARAFNLHVVAEGIEHESQSDLLIQLGCELAQGYLFARPLPVTEMEGYLAKVDASL